MIKKITICSMMLGFFIALGSVGAMENFQISELQCILQSLLGFAMCIPYGVYEYYKKHHNTI